MDATTHLIHCLFTSDVNLSPKEFDELEPKEQYVWFNRLRYEARSRIIPKNSGADTDAMLKEIDEKLSVVLFDQPWTRSQKMNLTGMSSAGYFVNTTANVFSSSLKLVGGTLLVRGLVYRLSWRLETRKPGVPKL